MNGEVRVRPFEDGDAGAVRALFIDVNRLLAPPHLREAFETYIDRSLTEEIDRIRPYYAARQGNFWVAVRDTEVLGMFGLETIQPGTLELRRMYVAPLARRNGIGRNLLLFAEAECRRRQAHKLELSTSELQPAALNLYRRAGYRLVREVVVEQASNKTLGGGIRRYHFKKCFRQNDSQDALGETTRASQAGLAALPAGPLPQAESYRPWLLL